MHKPNHIKSFNNYVSIDSLCHGYFVLFIKNDITLSLSIIGLNYKERKKTTKQQNSTEPNKYSISLHQLSYYINIILILIL